MKKDRRGFNLASKPSGNGCLECLASQDGLVVPSSRCAECGHIACCDSSPSQHASRHAAKTGHPIITSFEPGENWFLDYRNGEMIVGVELHPPHSHPRRSTRTWTRGKSASHLGVSAQGASVLSSPAVQFKKIRQIRLDGECAMYRLFAGSQLGPVQSTVGPRAEEPQSTGLRQCRPAEKLLTGRAVTSAGTPAKPLKPLALGHFRPPVTAGPARAPAVPNFALLAHSHSTRRK